MGESLRRCQACVFAWCLHTSQPLGGGKVSPHGARHVSRVHVQNTPTCARRGRVLGVYSSHSAGASCVWLCHYHFPLLLVPRWNLLHTWHVRLDRYVQCTALAMEFPSPVCTASLRVQLVNSASKAAHNQAFAEYVACSLLLFFVVVHFMG